MIKRFFISCLTLVLISCGGGGSANIEKAGGSTPPTPVSATSANVAPVYMDAGVSNLHLVNSIFTDVKVCAPGSTSNCVVIDHVLVDTGSVGLRLLNEVVPSKLRMAMPGWAAGSSSMGECLPFVSGVTWGSVKGADVHIGGSNFTGLTASNISVQIIGDSDPAFANIPSTCSNQGTMMQTASTLGANGVLGIGLFDNDCGPSCAAFAALVYYACTDTACTPSRMPLNAQVANPISNFTTHNNGSVLVLPDLPSTVASRLDGTLIFGIGTASNNSVPPGQAVIATNGSGMFSADYNGTILSQSFLDSGSSVNFFPAAGNYIFPECTGNLATFFCPTTDITLQARNSGRSGTTSIAEVFTSNALNSFTRMPNANVVKGLGAVSADLSSSLDLGASFFIGRSIMTLLENKTATGVAVQGPAFVYPAATAN